MEHLIYAVSVVVLVLSLVLFVKVEIRRRKQKKLSNWIQQNKALRERRRPRNYKLKLQRDMEEEPG